MASYLDILGNNLGYIFSKITIGQLALGLSRHDNTVSAAGLPVESDSIRKVATASAWIILDAINQCYFQFVSLEVVQPKLSVKSFNDAVTEAKAVRSTGPSTQGRSEGQ
eukprot:scaffold39787_cov788-Skeletonema_dohrnii-CCMP3373.AAC.2